MVGVFLEGAVAAGHAKIGIASPPNEPPQNDITVLFGLSQATMRAWKEINKHGRPYIYIDNCYIGMRKKTYRVTINAITAQTYDRHPGEDSQGRRYETLGLHPKPWRRDGKHILLCLQSELYFKLLVGIDRAIWIDRTCKEIRKYTDRRIIIRDKPNGMRPQPELETQLNFCHAVVTWNSTVAVHAMVAGVPAICLDPFNSFRSVCSGDLHTIEDPLKGAGRRELFHWLADNQWTNEEIQNGRCWSVLKGSR